MRPSAPNPRLWITMAMLELLSEDPEDTERWIELPNVSPVWLHGVLRLPADVQVVGTAIDYNRGAMAAYLSGNVPDHDDLMAVYDGTYPNARFVRFEATSYGHGARC